MGTHRDGPGGDNKAGMKEQAAHPTASLLLRKHGWKERNLQMTDVG